MPQEYIFHPSFFFRIREISSYGALVRLGGMYTAGCKYRKSLSFNVNVWMRFPSTNFKISNYVAHCSITHGELAYLMQSCAFNILYSWLPETIPNDFVVRHMNSHIMTVRSSLWNYCIMCVILMLITLTSTGFNPTYVSFVRNV